MALPCIDWRGLTKSLKDIFVDLLDPGLLPILVAKECWQHWKNSDEHPLIKIIHSII
jgi:hypothetical protein